MEQRDIFIVGTQNPSDDTVWQTYIENLEKLGLSTLMEVAQSAYDRTAAVDATAEQLNQIEELDPKRLPLVSAIPSYNATDTWENGLFEKYLRRYAKVVNPSVMTLDYYPFSGTRPEPFNQLDDKNLFLDIALNLQNNFRVYEVSGDDGTQSVRNRSTRSLCLELEPGDDIFLRFQDVM